MSDSGSSTSWSDAVKDGDTSSGKFWVFIIVVVLIVLLVVGTIVSILLCKRYRRRKRLQTELNDFDATQMWNQESTAPLGRPHPAVCS